MCRIVQKTILLWTFGKNLDFVVFVGLFHHTTFILLCQELEVQKTILLWTFGKNLDFVVGLLILFGLYRLPPAVL